VISDKSMLMTYHLSLIIGGRALDEQLRLLCVMAHPDDESLGVGATLARYGAEGVELHLVTATRGERGWFGAPEENPGLQELGRMREAELRAAAGVLRLHSLAFLGYIDGDLDQAGATEVAARIAHHVRRVKPHVVITFGPDGAYGHPDHIAISQFTMAGIVQAASARYDDLEGLPAHDVLKLYYMAGTAPQFKIYEEVFGELVMQVDGVERRPVPWSEWAVTTCVQTEEYWETARDAIACHRTQFPGYATLLSLPEAKLRKLWHDQAYYRVYSLVNGGREIERDLFEGIRAWVKS
jgi:LmbE family N-acetylglucosaminyl deacetylase